MIANVFSARCITNLHAGSGDVNYNIIDQEVERDPVTGLPMIHASGVKGALREFFETLWGKEDHRVKDFFGTEDSNCKQGDYTFLQADLLLRPLRVSDDSERTFVLATTKEILQIFSEKVNGLGGINDERLRAYDESGESVKVEGEEALRMLYSFSNKNITEKKFALVNNLNDYDLPVIARNKLDDSGISKNLWYEEFVPHESVFGLIIMTPKEMDADFKSALTGGPVQFGGNASIGYGLMKIQEL